MGDIKLINADGSLISNLVDMDVGREWDRHEHGTRESGTWDVVRGAGDEEPEKSSLTGHSSGQPAHLNRTVYRCNADRYIPAVNTAFAAGYTALESFLCG